EVAIEFGLTGPYVILLRGASAMIDGLWQATLLLGRGQCRRALVLAVETFAECEPLWARGRWLLRPPLVESAACALLVPGPRRATYAPASTPSPLEALVRVRAGETLACAPLIALALHGSRSACFIGLSMSMKERFGIVMAESQDLTRHFLSFDTLARFITARTEAA